jgi:prepilin-type N-terminal cleavage/methylation domain-containing protein
MTKGFTLIEVLIIVAILAILSVAGYNSCAGRGVAERCLHGQLYLYHVWDGRYIGPKLTSDGKPVSCAEAGQ